MSDPFSRTARNACDFVGSSISACATKMAKVLSQAEQQVRTSHMLGRFVVTGAEQFIRAKYAPVPAPESHTDTVGIEVDDHVQVLQEQEVETLPTEAPVPLNDYDLLTSSQVVEMLGTMTLGERQSVWNYENSHRRRRTILESSRVSDDT